MQIVLDTSAYSHFRAGHPAVIEHLTRAEVVHVPTTVIGELEAAFRIGSRTAENRVRLEEFLDEEFVRVVEVTRVIAQRYGLLFAALRAAGTPIPTNDIWIAAAAHDVSATVLTFDRDFERIAGLDAIVLAP